MSNLRTWDPLASTTSDEILHAAKRREVDNILKSYVGYYDVFSEMIQNALDAVDQRQQLLNERDYKKQIWIKLDLQNNTISVTDNGIGFSEERFRSFLCPHISFKNVGKTRGCKGVGATYLAYGFNYLQIGTKTPEFSFVGEIEGGRTWADSSDNKVSRPMIIEAEVVHSAFLSLDRGSTFSIKLGALGARPKNLNWVGATNAEQWSVVLLSKTPLGIVTYKDTDVHYTIEVVDDQGVSTTKGNTARYLFPHEVIPASIDVKDIQKAQQKLLDSGGDPSKLPLRYHQQNALYSYWDTEELLELFSNDDGAIALIKKYNVWGYSFFSCSVRIWDDYNDRIVGLRAGLRLLRGGLQIAANFMPQGELVTIPLTSSIGYQNQVHALVHFMNAEPDLGRKGFQPELETLSERISVAMVGQLKKKRAHLKKDAGATSNIIQETTLDTWIRTQEEYQNKNPLIISNPNFFKPIQEISILSMPQSEQDVVVLLNQLIAGGVIRGIKMMSASTYQQYDGIFRYFVNEPIANHEFDKDKNPLGVQPQTHQASIISKPYVLEYKYSMDALIQDFENEEKNENVIRLVVCWDIGKDWKKRYSVTSLLDLDNMHLRRFHGQTHLFVDQISGQERFDGIILSELIEYLNDVDGMQRDQREKYGAL